MESCGWMFLEEEEVVSGVFDRLLLSGVNRIPPMQGIVHPIADCFLGCRNFVQQSYWV